VYATHLAGTLAALALYDAVRRITGFIIPGLVAAATLAFSSVYWTHCLHAEAYVFYSSFLLFGINAAVRFVKTDKALWLYLTALFLGICVADRASELFVMPAFVVLWFFVRKKIHLSPLRTVLALVIFVLPFIYTTSFFLLRNGPEHFHSRDNILRNTIISGKSKPPDPAAYRSLSRAVKKCLGLTYTKKAAFKGESLKRDLDKYTWLLSGMGAFGDRFPEGDNRNNAQGRGTSISILGLLLGLAAMVFWRREFGWILFALTLFAGNLIFILWHSMWDNMTFIIPGLAGLCLLTGLGAAGPCKFSSRRKLLIFQACCLLVPLFLLASNYRLLDMSTPAQKKMLEYNQKLARAPIPENGVIVDTYWPAMTYRYLFYIQARRTDVQVLYSERKHWEKIITYFNERKQPVFVKANYLGPQAQKALSPKTPEQIAALGFLLVNPEAR
jgi:hypothetical protein